MSPKPKMIYLRYDLRKLKNNKCGFKPDGKRCKNQGTRFLLFYELRNPKRIESYIGCEDHWSTITQEIKKSHHVEWLGGNE